MSPVRRLCRHFLDQRAGKDRLSQDNTLGSFQRSVSSFRNQSSAQPDHSELVLRVRFMFRFDWHCIQLPAQCYSEDTREQGDIFCKASGCQHGPFTGVCPLDHCTEHASTHTARFPLLSQAGGWLLGPLDACSKERADKIQVLTTLWLKCLATPIVLFSSQPRKTFGQLFCGSLDNYGILCVGLYRVMDEKKQNLEHKREVCWLEKC